MHTLTVNLVLTIQLSVWPLCVKACVYAMRHITTSMARHSIQKQQVSRPYWQYAHPGSLMAA